MWKGTKVYRLGCLLVRSLCTSRMPEELTGWNPLPAWKGLALDLALCPEQVEAVMRPVGWLAVGTCKNKALRPLQLIKSTFY